MLFLTLCSLRCLTEFDQLWETSHIPVDDLDQKYRTSEVV